MDAAILVNKNGQCIIELYNAMEEISLRGPNHLWWIEVERRIRKGLVREKTFNLEMKERGKQDKEIDFE